MLLAFERLVEGRRGLTQVSPICAERMITCEEMCCMVPLEWRIRNRYVIYSVSKRMGYLEVSTLQQVDQENVVRMTKEDQKPHLLRE